MPTKLLLARILLLAKAAVCLIAVSTTIDVAVVGCCIVVAILVVVAGVILLQPETVRPLQTKSTTIPTQNCGCFFGGTHTIAGRSVPRNTTTTTSTIQTLGTVTAYIVRARYTLSPANVPMDDKF